MLCYKPTRDADILVISESKYMRWVGNATIDIHLSTYNFVWVYRVWFAWSQHKISDFSSGFCAGTSANFTLNDFLFEVINGVF